MFIALPQISGRDLRGEIRSHNHAKQRFVASLIATLRPLPRKPGKCNDLRQAPTLARYPHHVRRPAAPTARSAPAVSRPLPEHAAVCG
jgi:hypothetical protein